MAKQGLAGDGTHKRETEDLGLDRLLGCKASQRHLEIGERVVVRFFMFCDHSVCPSGG